MREIPVSLHPPSLHPPIRHLGGDHLSLSGTMYASLASCGHFRPPLKVKRAKKGPEEKKQGIDPSVPLLWCSMYSVSDQICRL